MGGMITVFVVALSFLIPAALIEGFASLYRRAKEAREWRKIKRVYYPRNGGVRA